MERGSFDRTHDRERHVLSSKRLTSSREGITHGEARTCWALGIIHLLRRAPRALPRRLFFSLRCWSPWRWLSRRRRHAGDGAGLAVRRQSSRVDDGAPHQGRNRIPTFQQRHDSSITNAIRQIHDALRHVAVALVVQPQKAEHVVFMGVETRRDKDQVGIEGLRRVQNLLEAPQKLRRPRPPLQRHVQSRCVEGSRLVPGYKGASSGPAPWIEQNRTLSRALPLLKARPDHSVFAPCRCRGGGPSQLPQPS